MKIIVECDEYGGIVSMIKASRNCEFGTGLIPNKGCSVFEMNLTKKMAKMTLPDLFRNCAVDMKKKQLKVLCK